MLELLWMCKGLSGLWPPAQVSCVPRMGQHRSRADLSCGLERKRKIPATRRGSPIWGDVSSSAFNASFGETTEVPMAHTSRGKDFLEYDYPIPWLARRSLGRERLDQDD